MVGVYIAGNCRRSSTSTRTAASEEEKRRADSEHGGHVTDAEAQEGKRAEATQACRGAEEDVDTWRSVEARRQAVSRHGGKVVEEVFQVVSRRTIQQYDVRQTNGRAERTRQWCFMCNLYCLFKSEMKYRDRIGIQEK